jgi:hypothetical protein
MAAPLAMSARMALMRSGLSWCGSMQRRKLNLKAKNNQKLSKNSLVSSA